MIKFKTLPKLLARERCNAEGMDGNLLQNKVFFWVIFKGFFCVIFRLEGIFRDTKAAGRVPVCFRKKLENYLSNAWEIRQFSNFSPIFPLAPL